VTVKESLTAQAKFSLTPRQDCTICMKAARKFTSSRSIGRTLEQDPCWNPIRAHILRYLLHSFRFPIILHQMTLYNQTFLLNPSFHQTVRVLDIIVVNQMHIWDISVLGSFDTEFLVNEIIDIVLNVLEVTHESETVSLIYPVYLKVQGTEEVACGEREEQCGAGVPLLAIWVGEAEVDEDAVLRWCCYGVVGTRGFLMLVDEKRGWCVQVDRVLRGMALVEGILLGMGVRKDVLRKLALLIGILVRVGLAGWLICVE
jgi:hypothetical protein